MAKLPWMKFYPADYLLDTTCLSLAARGVWMDLICLLWRSDDRGRLSTSKTKLAKILRCDYDDLCNALTELHDFTICDMVTNGNDDVTLESRRMTREEKVRNNTRIRVQRHRVTKASNTEERLCNKEKSEVRSQKSEVRSQKEEKRVSVRTADDAVWLEGLKENPAYSHIDLTVEFGKMDAWLSIPKNTHRKRTRSFIVNWLNKIESPVAQMSGPAARAAPIPPFPGPEDPIGRNLWRRTYGDPANPQRQT